MNHKQIPDKIKEDQILQDELVQYLAVRHHTTTSHLMAHLSDIGLEENEVAIIQDLIQMYNPKQCDK